MQKLVCSVNSWLVPTFDDNFMIECCFCKCRLSSRFYAIVIVIVLPHLIGELLSA